MVKKIYYEAEAREKKEKYEGKMIPSTVLLV